MYNVLRKQQECYGERIIAVLLYYRLSCICFALLHILNAQLKFFYILLIDKFVLFEVRLLSAKHPLAICMLFKCLIRMQFKM